jgi:hypothetical protein
MGVFLKLLLVGIVVLPVSLPVRVADWMVVFMPSTGMSMIVVVMVISGLPLLGLIYMETMA